MIPRFTRAAVASAAVVCGLTAFAGDGIRAYFTPDDMMNLYAAWSASAVELVQGHRPFGGLVYRGLFGLFGLNPLPFRVVCFCLLLANLFLLYAFCLRLTQSREVAVLACLLGAYRAHLAELYYSTGTLYDLLCYFFIFQILVLYLGIRARGSYPTWRQTAFLMGLYLCALGAKESGVVVPPLVALYEWIYQFRQPYSWAGFRRWLVSGALFFYWSIPITVLFILFRTVGGHAMARNADFAPHISLHVFLTGWEHYLAELFYGAIQFNSFKVVTLLALLLGLAAYTRRRELLFAWCVIMVGVLPFIFIAPRGFFEMYIPLPGWYLYAASALVLVRDGLLRHLPRLAETFQVRPEQLAMFVVVAALLIPLHRRQKPLGNSWVAAGERAVRPVLEQLVIEHRPLRPGAKVLFLSDPYPIDEWMLTFMFRLYYRDKNLQVIRAKVWPALAEPGVRGEYDRVFVLDQGGLREAGR